MRGGVNWRARSRAGLPALSKFANSRPSFSASRFDLKDRSLEPRKAGHLTLGILPPTASVDGINRDGGNDAHGDSLVGQTTERDIPRVRVLTQRYSALRVPAGILEVLVLFIKIYRCRQPSSRLSGMKPITDTRCRLSHSSSQSLFSSPWFICWISSRRTVLNNRS